MAKSPPIVLVFAASDPTGGAGMQADILTLAACGCHPISVVTALTVQDTRGVERVQPVDPALLAEQARCLLADFRVAAVKIGVLGSAENVEAVARILAAQPHAPVIVDPVLASGRGDAPFFLRYCSNAMPPASACFTFSATPSPSGVMA